MLQHSFPNSGEKGAEFHKKLPQVADHGFFLHFRTLPELDVPFFIQVQGRFYNFDFPYQIALLFSGKAD